MNTNAPFKKLQRAADNIRKRGQRSDNILAHINPREAALLHRQFGGDINPYTGLPQYGLFGNLFGKKKVDAQGNIRRTGLRKAFHGLHGLEKGLRPILKAAAPLAGTMVGTLFGGPMGSVLGGALGGALSSKKHPLDHALGGALIGLGGSFILPKIGSMMGLDPRSTSGGLFGMNAPSWGEQLGFGAGAPSAMAGPPGLEFYQGLGSAPPVASGMGGSAMEFAKSLGLKDMMDVALLGTTIAGSLGAKTKYPKEPGLAEIMQTNMPMKRPEDAYKPLPPYKVKKKKAPAGYKHGIEPEFPFFELEEGPEYAHGGYVKGGYIHGEDGGQSDTRPVRMPEGSYVMDATTVSLLGDGNSVHGAKKVKQLEDNFMRTGITRDLQPSRNIKARVSDGEYIIQKDAVTNIGRGDNYKGSKILDKMRNNLRAQKGVKKFLPPKTKQLTHYLR